MTRYEVFLNLDGSGYLLDVQSGLLDGFSTRLVTPLLPASQAPKPATRLNPVVNIGNQTNVTVTQFMADVPEKLLTKHVTSVVQMRDEITAAIDMLTRGI